MDIQEIFDIVKAFFDAILRVFEELGLIAPKAEGEDATETE